MTRNIICMWCGSTDLMEIDNNICITAEYHKVIRKYVCNDCGHFTKH